MPKYQFDIEGPCAECVAGEISPVAAAYWSKQGSDNLQQYMGCDADSRHDEFDVPEDAQIDVEWTEMDSEAHINGPLVDEKTVLVVWDVDQDKVVLRVPISEVRISIEEVLDTDDEFEDETLPLFKAVAYGKGDFVTDPIEVESSLLRTENLTISVFTFEDGTTVVTVVGICDDLQDLEEESSRTNSMTCWVD
ncbi:MAG: hypothetical protein RLZ63_355 [Pseudomonadota bacterium]|jgi:hypothetical protein